MRVQELIPTPTFLAGISQTCFDKMGGKASRSVRPVATGKSDKSKGRRFRVLDEDSLVSHDLRKRMIKKNSSKSSKGKSAEVLTCATESVRSYIASSNPK